MEYCFKVPLSLYIVFQTANEEKTVNEKRPFPLLDFDFIFSDNEFLRDAKKAPKVSLKSL